MVYSLLAVPSFLFATDVPKEFVMTHQYNAREKKTRRLAKVDRKKAKVREAIKKAEEKRA
jgi:hypothetical protein